MKNIFHAIKANFFTVVTCNGSWFSNNTFEAKYLTVFGFSDLESFAHAGYSQSPLLADLKYNHTFLWFSKSLQKIIKTRKLKFIPEQHFVERKNEGRNQTRLEFMPRNLDQKCLSRIPSQYPINICSLFQWLKARPMWRAKQQEKNNAKFDNFAKEASTI